MTYFTCSSSLTIALIISAALVVASANASAQANMRGHEHQEKTPAGMQNVPSALSEGEVQKVDKGIGKLTIKHGPLNNLDMPSMTMAFNVQEPAMLDRVKAGDQVRFRVERVNGGMTVTRLELSR